MLVTVKTRNVGVSLNNDYYNLLGWYSQAEVGKHVLSNLPQVARIVHEELTLPFTSICALYNNAKEVKQRNYI